MRFFGHRTGSRGVNGNMHIGCDAIIMCRNCPILGESDSKWEYYIIEMYTIYVVDNELF